MTLKFQGQDHSQGQIRWSHLRLRVQLICLLFVSWRSNHFWPRYSEFHIWPWKFEVKVKARVKSRGHIWGSKISPSACFLFRIDRTILGRDIANSIFDLENSRSRSWPGSNSMVTFEAQGSVDVFASCFASIRQFLAEIYVKFYIWPWTCKVKVMAKVKSHGDIWGSGIGRCICFLFHVDRNIFVRDIANSIFDLEYSRSRSRRNSTKI